MATNSPYEHIFIDLDKTLWDFERNSLETFKEIYNKYDLNGRGISSMELLLVEYTRINDMLWGLYRQNQIKKEVLNIRRFEMTLNEFGIDDLILATHIAEDYVNLSPMKNNLFPEARKALDYLKPSYPLHIITNGFEEVQQKKLDVSDLRKYFTTITTSEEAGVKKPESKIFQLALRKAKASPEKSLMIGDDLAVDMEGASNIGMDTMYFNPQGIPHQEKVTFEIRSWKEINKYL
jgi:putative hydrolase of the HAD superfamily